MATLLDALSDGSFDMQNKRDLSSNFARNLTSLRDTIVNDYVKHKMDLNKSIANLAKSKNLNDDQIQRVIEEVNNQVYLIEYSKLKEEPERHVTFDIAMLPKIKKIMDGKFEEEPKQQQEKKASEHHSFEKIASTEEFGDSLNMFNSNSTFKCPLKLESAEDESKIFLKKIAFEISEENQKLEKLGKNLDRELSTFGMALVKYAQLGHDTNKIITEVSKQANLNEMHTQLIKIATEKRTEDLKATTPISDDFCVELNIEKSASETFTLGKFSKMAPNLIEIPTIISDNKSIAGINGLVKIANEIASISDEYKVRAENYDVSLDKIASLGLGDNAIDKLNKGFFKSELSVANTEKVASLNSSALSNATKTLDSILAKNKKKLNINPIPSLDTKMTGKRFDYGDILKKAAPKKKVGANAGFKPAGQNKGYSSFNLQ